MTNDIEIDYNSVIQVYQKRLSDLIQQNILLEARGNILTQTVNSLREKITELEETKSTSTKKKPVVNTTNEDFT
jgi:vacuolar-type H+-ATPase subunit E/Vma4